MSKTESAKPAPAPRTRKPLIMTKKSQGTRRAVQDTKERQDAMQKQHTADYKAAQGGKSEE